MKLFNTLGRELQDFTPIENNQVKIYNCGLTVYSQPHIGNWVYFIFCDTLERTLVSNGYKVKRVQNITDVGHLTDDADAGEDKMLKGALSEGKTAWQVAEKYIDIADHEAYELLNLIRPQHMPRATNFIKQQVAFVEELDQKGYTYRIEDGIYFDTSKLDNYGELACLDISGLQFGARVADTGKKNPTDFALWKFSSPSESRDMEWVSPWGIGFPGWHLECSVMARELLGDQIDIHTGGIDHISVHHTNEIAQTEAVTNKKFANYWLHSNHLKVDGKKISKSLGNIYTLEDITKKGFDLQAFKLMVLSKHYRTEGNFTWEIMQAAANRLSNWYNTANLRWQTGGQETDTSENLNDNLLHAVDKLKEHLQNDLDTPAALAFIDEVFSQIDSSDSPALSRTSFVSLLESINQLLGIDLLKPTPDITDVQKELIAKRESARAEKDWQRSDELRDELASGDVLVRDTSFGSIWTRKY